MGSPSFAAAILDGLERSGMRPIAVFTQEDKAGDRGHRLIEPEVKTRAKELGIPVFQPRRLKEEPVLDELRRLSPDLIVVAAYGKLLPREVLEIPRIAPVNVHASILPRWRGASPVHYAILAGDRTTGVSIMKMEEGLDTGPVYMFSDEVEIGERETAGELSSRLAAVGAGILPRALAEIVAGKVPEPQDDSKATLAPKIKKQDGVIRFELRAEEIERMVRAFRDWPRASFDLRGERICVLEAETGPPAGGEVPGEALSRDRLWFGCGEGSTIIFKKVQREGRRALSAEDFIKGFRIEKGEKAGTRAGR